MKNITVILIALLPVALFAQSLERQVIASSGSYSETANLQVSSTIGETVIATGTSASVILTQGFQQPASDNTVGIEEPEFGFSMQAYPNPTANMVILDFNADKELELQISLIDVMGKQYPVAKSNITVLGNSRQQIDLSAYAAGNYFIRIDDEKGQFSKTIKIQKID
ncbi:MAG: T9SS type A sorting domain-containing protein [Chitinophagales bacterium]